MGQRYILDSNVIIDYSKLRFTKTQEAFLDEIVETDFVTSMVIKIEVLGFDDLPQVMKSLEQFLSQALTYYMNDETTRIAIDLRRKHRMKLGDSIIAATALQNQLTLITRNTADFKFIQNLNLLDAHTIQ